MPTETIVVGVPRDDGTEDITIEADQLDRDRDGTLRAYDDGVEIGVFPPGSFAVREDNLGG
jgi:hypothetical protein